MNIEIILIILFNLIKLINTINISFSNPLQRFLYDDITNTIILASVNHLYSLNASDLSILTDINNTPDENDNQCLITNKTFSTPNYYFPLTSYLIPSINNTFNQLLLLLNNNSILTCSTSNRGGSCQLRSLINLNLIKNSSQRLVSSSPYYPSIGFFNENKQILYLSNTYDLLCDPFYEIPTISGRYMNEKDFLSIINLNSGQSALQQSTYTLRLLNIRLVKDFFLYYLYGFQHQNISYFLTIQQSDIHHTRKSKLQTKILRFCQTLKQSIIKSYIEIPITCGLNYHYLITAKFSRDNNILYGIFRNTTLANSANTSHAICAYSIDKIREAFFQTLKRCLVDGKGYRGLGFISPDTHCMSNKNLNEINHDYCPNDDDSFFQYPIGDDRSLEQIEPIIEFNDKVNFTSIEILSIDDINDELILLGDDHGTVYSFQISNKNEISKQNFPSSTIIDLQIINKKPLLKNANLLVLTNNQIIKQNLSTCEQYETCEQCSKINLCHWCSQEKRCASTFECINEYFKYKNLNEINMCINIEQVIPETISLSSSNNKFEIILNKPLDNNLDEYQCQFSLNERLFYTTGILLNDKTLKCLPPEINNLNQAVYNIILSIYQLKTNLTFGYYNLVFINCSNFYSCSSCTKYSEQCLWNIQTINCISYDKTKKSLLINRKRFISNINQCPQIYLQQTINRLALNDKRILTIHIEQCKENISINSCQLNDYRKRFIFFSINSIILKSSYDQNLCLLKCSFQLSNFEHIHQLSFHRPIHLNLSIEFNNKTSIIIPRTHISLYNCERLALNCTTCLQLDPSYGCIWCNNMCMFKNQTNQLICRNNEECLSPIIQIIEPLLLPINGGTLVTIKGKNFDLFNLSIHLVDIPCHIIEEESSDNKIVCQSGNAGTSRTGFVNFKFGPNGPELSSHQMISYINPIINSIEPLIGIESGGTLLTIYGENLTIGNSHISISIGNRPCQLLSISRIKIQCETTIFPSLMLNEQQQIKFHFDRQTKLFYDKFFTIVSNPILYSFDKTKPYQSFMSGGHPLIIHGDYFHTIQNIRLEFKRLIFVSPFHYNKTHFIFLTPSIQELQLNHDNNYQQEIEIILHLDHFNQTSSVIYINDPLIYELEPMLQTYTNQLIIYGINLTNIGHTKNDISIHIGCDLCIITEFQSNKIICQPPFYRPKKYSNTNRLCYDSEHPWIIVTIDNIHSHVGYMIYPKKLIILGIISGCLLTILLIVLIILIIVCIRIRCSKRKIHRRYLYNTGINHHENEKETYNDNLITKTYQKFSTKNLNLIDSSCSPIPIRSYMNYLQICYYYYYLSDLSSIPSYDIPKVNIKYDILEQFHLLIDNNEQFIECFYKILLKSSNKKLLTNLLLTQRYHFKKFLQFNNDFIYLNICFLTAFDGFITNQITSLLYQLYYQLKLKIYSGPIDSIEQTCSYYSLNNHTILHDQSMLFNSIQLTIHIDWNNNNNNKSEDLLLLNVTCLTCDTISQVKEKIIQQINFYKKFDLISINQSQLYLLTNIKSNNNSCSTSSCSSSTTSSSNVPLAKKSLITQFFFNRTMKYSTTTTTTTATTLNDSYKDSINLLLNDIDNTNEQINHCKKLNTLQHYGILNDGYEFKFILSKINKQTNSTPNLIRTLPRKQLECQHYSIEYDKIFNYLTSLPHSSLSPLDYLINENDRIRYFHLLNHTYEEIGECGHLLMNNNQSEIYRLFETKSTIHSILINLIEILFTNFLHSDTYLSELIEQYSRILHIFYGHFIPFILQNINCLFDITIEKCLISSFDILSTIFQIACSSQFNEQHCLLCNELIHNNSNLNLNIQNCTLLFADEIQRVRLHYTNLERRLNNKNLTSEYSSTDTGINKTFELDNSILTNLIEYLCSHIDEFTEVLNNQSSDNKNLIIFYNLVHMYRSTGRT